MTGAQQFLVKWAQNDADTGSISEEDAGLGSIPMKRIPVGRLTRFILQSNEGAILETIANLERESPGTRATLRNLLKYAVR